MISLQAMHLILPIRHWHNRPLLPARRAGLLTEILTAIYRNKPQGAMMQIHWKNVRSTTFWYSMAGLYTLTVIAVVQ